MLDSEEKKGTVHKVVKQIIGKNRDMLLEQTVLKDQTVKYSQMRLR